MPRSSIGFIVRSSSLAAATVAAVTIASASQQDVEGVHRVTLRPATYEAVRASHDSKAGETSSNVFERDQTRIGRSGNVPGSIGLLAARDIGSGEQYAAASADAHSQAEEAQPVALEHPVKLTSILATLALVAFYFLRRLI